MKKFIGTVTSIALISGFSASVALADTTHVVKITANCPDISNKTKDKLTNYGTYIAGVGTIRVNSGAPKHPLFQSPTVQGGNIPIDLKAAGYDGTHVTYNPKTGAVVCYFQSNKGYDPFMVSYVMTNALGGTTSGSGDEEIKLKVQVG